jgi:flagellar biosynthesis protein FlhA
LDAGAVPITRVGLTAAQHSFGAHDRARRGVMTDVAAAGGAPKFNLPGIGEIGSMLKRGDLALAIGVMLILVVLQVG